MKVLLRFIHGLGDAVQLTCILQHLRVYRPDWELFLVARIGKETVGRGFCTRVWHDLEPPPDRAAFDHVFDLGWYENYNAYRDCPNSKVTNCLREVFGIDPDPELLHYEIHYAPEDRAAAADYYRSLDLTPRADGRFPVVVAHHRGNTSRHKKDLTDGDLAPLARRLAEYGHRLVVLDWDRRVGAELAATPGVSVCSHTAAPELWKHYGTGDAARIAALTDLAVTWVGIDSGPGHVGGATTTPGLVVWVAHHPIHFYDLCPNVTHLLPEGRERMPPADRPGVFDYFTDHYNWRPYRHLAAELPAHVLDAARLEPLTANPMTRSHMLTAKNFHTEYYEQHKAAGLDYLGHGEWQTSYGKWLVEALDWGGRHVLDVGCACGSIALGLRKAGAVSHGVDLNNHMIALGKNAFSGVPLYVCDAVNLHLFGDDSFTGLHHNQVAEHWKEELVPFILRELLRVMKPGAVLFAAFDTLDLFERQKRNDEVEDATNHCIRPLAWWHRRYHEAGFVRAPDLEAKLKDHPQSFFKRYDWDWLVVRKPEVAADPASRLEETPCGFHPADTDAD